MPAVSGGLVPDDLPAPIDRDYPQPAEIGPDAFLPEEVVPPVRRKQTPPANDLARVIDSKSDAETVYRGEIGEPPVPPDEGMQ